MPLPFSLSYSVIFDDCRLAFAVVSKAILFLLKKKKKHRQHAACLWRLGLLILETEYISVWSLNCLYMSQNRKTDIRRKQEIEVRIRSGPSLTRKNAKEIEMIQLWRFLTCSCSGYNEYSISFKDTYFPYIDAQNTRQ